MTEQEPLIDFLKKTELFSSFTDSELSAFLPYMTEAVYEEGAFIFREGERGQDLYLIKKGQVEIVIEDKEHQEQYPLARLKQNDCFGEINVLGKNVRMASSRAVERTEALVFHFQDLHKLAETDPLFSRLTTNLAKQAGKHLKDANEMALFSTKRELKLTMAHDQMGQFIIHLFILLTLYFYVIKIFEQFSAESILMNLITAGLVLCFAVSGTLFVKKSGYPLEFYGVTLKNWRKNAIEGILFTIPVLLFMVGLKWMLITTVSDLKKFSLFEFGDQPRSFFHFFQSSDQQQHFLMYLGLYIALVPLQEFIARGCLQSCLRNFFRSPNRAILAILTSNLLFGLFHGLKTFTFVACAFAMGIFWGWIYERQRSLVGPSISHALVGAWAFGVLNFQSILIY